VILDEPTAAPGVAQTNQVLELVKQLRAQGLAVVVITTHNLHLVFDVADRIMVLRLGRRVATFKHDQTTPEEVVAAMLGGRKQVII
jgi:D-xylose transport system ATP-binding protein